MRSPPAELDQRSLVDRIFDPEWAGGWTATRYLFVFAGILEHGWRVTAIEGCIRRAGHGLCERCVRVAEYVTLTPPMGYALWALSILGLFCVAYGGRLLRPRLAAVGTRRVDAHGK